MNFQQPYSQEMDQDFFPSASRQEFFHRFPQALWITLCIVCRQPVQTCVFCEPRAGKGGRLRIIRTQIQWVVRLSVLFRQLLALPTMKTGPLWTEARRKPRRGFARNPRISLENLVGWQRSDHRSLAGVHPRFEIVTGH